MRTGRRVVMCVLAVGLAACSRGEPGGSAVGVSDRNNEYVSAAADGDRVALAWSATDDASASDVYVAMSADGGRTFGPPRRVNAPDRPASVGGEQPPRVAFVKAAGGSRAVVVIWTAKAEAGTRLLVSRSSDDGQTFETPRVVPGTDAAGNRGWESLAVDGSGRAHVVWLDHRDTAASMAADHGVHRHGASAPASGETHHADAIAAEDGVARAQRSQLFIGGLDGPPQSVARGVCYCCKTAVVATADGAVYAAWRHVYPGNRRDIAFVASRDGGRSFSEPVRVSEDNWALDGCPENGPSLAHGADGRVHVLWPTLVTENGAETLKLFTASTRDGETFTDRVALPTAGAAYHPQLVAAADGRLFAAWEEASPGAPRRIRIARARDGGASGADRAIANRDAVPAESLRFELLTLDGDTRGTYPALAVTRDALLIVWTTADEPSSIAVRRVPL